ncbi:hypothetical protein GSB46_005640, partial [Salmonella enterica]|nr:hypothetical protein [Salmonella enterica]EDZ5934558.1 hypothetical protein [Salmonella enterica]
MYRHQQVRVVMPEHYHSGDENWIQEQLLQLDPTTRVKISAKYAEVYR